jgi:hypothetical protein
LPYPKEGAQQFLALKKLTRLIVQGKHSTTNATRTHRASCSNNSNNSNGCSVFMTQISTQAFSFAKKSKCVKDETMATKVGV